jgi:hypothetical protein
MEDPQRIRQAGMEQAAVVWEILANLSNPLHPVDIIKAVASLKCSEFTEAIHGHRQAPEFLKLVLQFLEDIMNIVGKEGSLYGGARALEIIEDAMPLTEEISNDPAAFAQRQHTFEGLHLLAAARLGKEAEIKKCHDLLHRTIGALIIRSYGVDPEAPTQA